MITESEAKNVLKIYEDAWVNQDTKKILSIFAKDAIYHEYQLKAPMIGHKEIEKYWQSKVCTEQSNIKFKLLNQYICKDTIIAEWDVSFDSNLRKSRIHLREIAVFEIKENKIQKYREYWHSEEKLLDKNHSTS